MYVLSTTNSKHYYKMSHLLIFPGIGAHSHIRGLGLDDALDPRQTSQGTILFVFFVA